MSIICYNISVMKNSPGSVFDYRLLRFLTGIIALCLPVIVSVFSYNRLSSISEAYCTESHDIFVGLLFIVGALLFVYNGHKDTEPYRGSNELIKKIWINRQSVVSKIGAVAAVCVAVCPVPCGSLKYTVTSVIHYSSALILFSILIYFCLGPFRKNTKGEKGKKGLRNIIYLSCGSFMIAAILLIFLNWILVSTLPDNPLKPYNPVYWAEAVLLWGFGIAWFASGKIFKFLADDEDVLKLL
jgi:hypothetical protein